ncbi:MAG: hypothetical protein AVDCRST_MAG87-1522 [uncultured Thermomicrobiales bacterium]|uniref:Uncharacterized protein n=1 Tax=uncultured Thermomicrobiales bacterium TaxID=1645740 RepID=A0A6J4UT56_9BACT|nr:MAG: hypothetical protein AVDCRST_MAG87-1522 [uncultured Thermomicrobiales bacterium]
MMDRRDIHILEREGPSIGSERREVVLVTVVKVVVTRGMDIDGSSMWPGPPW